MDIRKLQRAIVDGLEDVKAQNIVVFNTEHLSPLFERVIIASGTSNRQTKALASSVRETVKGRGLQVMRTEGEDNGEWIIVDCGAAVVHVMQPAIREYYHLEEIWGGKPVKLKMGGDEPRKLVKASEDMDEADEALAPKKKPATKTVAKKAAPAKTAAAKPATKAPAKTTAKKGGAKSVATKTVGSKTPAAKTIKVGAAKPALKKTAAKPAAKPSAKPAVKRAAGKTAGKPLATKAAAKVAVKKIARG